MSRVVSVKLDDVVGAINYLEGLEVILRRLHLERRGVAGGDPLLDELGVMEADNSLEFSRGEWEPLRYQDGVGQGWEFVADNLADLRYRLIEGVGNVAL